jgi:ABC-type sugar transport system permease subunit
VFFAPLLLFFIGTGWYQTQNRDRLKDPSEAETWVQKFRVVHTDQIYPSELEFKKRSSPKLFSWLVGVMSAAMIATTVLGLVLAFRVNRSVLPVLVVFALGVAVPAVILWAGQQR